MWIFLLVLSIKAAKIPTLIFWLPRNLTQSSCFVQSSVRSAKRVTLSSFIAKKSPISFPFTLILNTPALAARWPCNHKHMDTRQCSQSRFCTIHLTTIKQLSQGWWDQIKVMGNHISRAPCGSLSRMIMRSTEDGGTYLINGNIIAYSKWGPPAERLYDYYCDPSLSCCWERLASGRTWVMRTAWIGRLQLLFISGWVRDGWFGMRIEGDDFNHSRINTSI